MSKNKQFPIFLFFTMLITGLIFFHGCSLTGDSDKLFQIEKTFLESMDSLENSRFEEAIRYIKSARNTSINWDKYVTIRDALDAFETKIIELYVTEKIMHAECHFKNKRFAECQRDIELARDYSSDYTDRLDALQARNYLLWGYYLSEDYNETKQTVTLIESLKICKKLLEKSNLLKIVSQNKLLSKYRKECEEVPQEASIEADKTMEKASILYDEEVLGGVNESKVYDVLIALLLTINLKEDHQEVRDFLKRDTTRFKLAFENYYNEAQLIVSECTKEINKRKKDNIPIPPSIYYGKQNNRNLLVAREYYKNVIKFSKLFDQKDSMDLYNNAKEGLEKTEKYIRDRIDWALEEAYKESAKPGYERESKDLCDQVILLGTEINYLESAKKAENLKKQISVSVKE